MTNINRNITDFNNLDLELYFATQILKLTSLHYGYWHKGDRLSLANLKKAQSRYTQTLIKLIPSKAKTILDVGAGIGDNAKALSKLGYKVTAISPDKNHPLFYQKYPEIKFFPGTWEDFSSKEKFDLILMSESQNYFDTNIGFQQCQKYLKPDSYLLVSGKFRKTDSREFSQVTNTEKNYEQEAKKHHLFLLKKQDITRNVLPTLRLARLYYQKYFLPTIKMGQFYLASSLTPSQKMFKFLAQILLAKQVGEIKRLVRLYQEHLDPVLFRKHVRYHQLLFQFHPTNRP